MNYRFTETALNSLLDFEQSTAEKVQKLIGKADGENLYKNKSYSYIYDQHGRPWDKLDLKIERLNHRVFFTKTKSTFHILEIFHRDRIEYNNDIYSLFCPRVIHIFALNSI